MMALSLWSRERNRNNRLLLPEQVSVSKEHLISCNYFERNMIKHEPRSCFLSEKRLLLAALLESDSQVNQYVPRPFALRDGQRQYIPDFYIKSVSGETVLDLISKPITKALMAHRTEYFSNYGYNYDVIDGKTIVNQLCKAKNWLLIVQHLYLFRGINTHVEENLVYAKLIEFGPLSIAELLELTYDIDKQHILTALYRQAHDGVVKIQLDKERLNFETRVEII